MIIQASDTAAPHVRPKDPASEDGAGFNLAMASSSLEARASASLKAFGGDSAKQVASSSSSASAPAQSRSVRAAKETQIRAASAESIEAAPLVAERVVEGWGATLPKGGGTPASAGSVTAVTSQSIQSSVVQGKAEIAAGAREAVMTRQGGTAAAPKTRHALPTATKEFAELLTKRLQGGASEFDLRLDPPELGKVHAKLHASGDGKAILALSFENQSALDLFARDHASLLFAFASAGFDLSQHDLKFSLADQSDAATDPCEKRPLVFDAELQVERSAAVRAGFIDMKI